jgi:hypothetical protein
MIQPSTNRQVFYCIILGASPSASVGRSGGRAVRGSAAVLRTAPVSRSLPIPCTLQQRLSDAVATTRQRARQRRKKAHPAPTVTHRPGPPVAYTPAASCATLRYVRFVAPFLRSSLTTLARLRALWSLRRRAGLYPRASC